MHITFAPEPDQLSSLAVVRCHWITQRLPYFSPWQDGRISDVGFKAFAELTVLYSYFEEWRTRSFGLALPLNELSAWRAFILRHCENPVYAEVARKDPLRALYYLRPYLMLRTTGYRAPLYEDTLKRLRRWGFPKWVELPPCGFLEHQHLLWKTGYLHSEPNWHQLYRKTLLGCRCKPIYMDNMAAYLVTHTLFYLTDFGSRPPPLPDHEVEHVTRVVECLLVHYWRLGHWDLTVELLINLNSSGKSDSPFYTGSSRAIQNACHTDGAIPLDQSAEEQLQAAQDPDRETLVFRLCYHTTLMSLFLSSTTLIHGSEQ